MKHYTTIFCCLVLSAVLIFVPSAHAASLSVLIPTQTRLNLVNQYTPAYDSTDNPIGSLAIYTYYGSIDVSVSGISLDGYNNGLFRFVVTPSVSVPTGYSFQSLNVSISGLVNTESYFTSYQRATNNYGVTTFSVYFDNHTQHNSGVAAVAVMDFTVTISKTVTTTNLPDPEPYITLSTSASVSNNIVSGSTEPIDFGLAGIIRQAIVNGINDGSLLFDDILLVLEDIRTQDQTNYATIIQFLSDNDTFNSTLYQWLQNVLESDFSSLLDDTTYISTYLYSVNNIISAMNGRDSQYYPLFDSMLSTIATKLQTLIDLQNAAGTQANNVESAADNLENQINQANNYQAPDVNFMLTQADQIMVNGQSGMNLIATIINEPWIVQILLVVVSLAFVGYLLYGKGV